MSTEHDLEGTVARGDATKGEPSITVPPAIRPDAPESAVLAAGGIALYYANLPNWRAHQGEHVLIHGGAVHGFFPTRKDARREGFRRFGPVAFLVKQVDLDEKPRPLVRIVL
jgi:hypothetical protein